MDKILTSHVGSLPRSQEVVDFIFATDLAGFLIIFPITRKIILSKLTKKYNREI